MFQYPSTFYIPMVVGLDLKILRTLQEIYKSSEALEYFQSSRENNIFFVFKNITKECPEKRKVQSIIWLLSHFWGPGRVIKKYRDRKKVNQGK